MREVECKEIQPLQRYVGVSYDVSQDEIWCSQETYASSLNDRGVRPLVNPIPDAARKQADTSLPLNKKETKAFQKSLGELSYLASFTRPDLVYGTSHMAQWNAAPTMNAFAWLQRLVSWARAHSHRGVAVPRSPRTHPLHVELHTGASFGTPAHPEPQIGWVLTVCGCPLAWKSIKPKKVAKSTTDAEFLAAENGVEFLSSLLLFFAKLWPTVHRTLWSDSHDLVSLVGQPSGSEAKATQPSLAAEIDDLREKEEVHTSMVSILQRAVHQDVQEKFIALEHISTVRNLADPLTKGKSTHELYRLLEQKGREARQAATRPPPDPQRRPILLNPDLQREVSVFFENVNQARVAFSQFFPYFTLICPTRSLRDASVTPLSALHFCTLSLALAYSAYHQLGHASDTCPDVEAERKGRKELYLERAGYTGRGCTFCAAIGFFSKGHRAAEHEVDQRMPPTTPAPVTSIERLLKPQIL
uniref:Reverse transcriptase Ty1/copia-type domain-containing protein n=1 Tax=Chromera velia CCMP2878 TaxID=1169474 RepID=A0A0G4HUQ9_9ALVE|eukprot:Cvel_31980.t1-p1 / transcript=Cvel_31980.t1 / gene=Cvel_31980 / organism=Chromera_velia_CCMP2878 / gene_product=Uncharacterized mitochondrial protein AtMg00810, putative / transcript_product=Uncharacterized mitochondrial protein AtMg00810, putative / location=Cvel_scaffold4868:5476-6888(+) / protein_length=471 / sequence_SO=supercontig / SO=protein_coding / is_pseudo=false